MTHLPPSLRHSVPSAASPTASPARIGKYRIDGVLGEGAMGVVYRGHDVELDRPVAVKTLRKALLGEEGGSELLVRFRREAEAGMRLSHRHVVTVYEFGEDTQTAFMAMEFIAGRTLKELNAERAPWPLLEALDLAQQLLDALDFFHERGVVHRDIKPANIMIDAGGRLTVTDFGVARVTASELTQVGTVLGTPSYMSPEQITGQPIDGRSDLFAVGVVLYEMLTGERPFRGEMITIAHRIVCEPHPEPSSLNRSLPPAVDALFARALAKSPDARFCNGTEFRAALRAMLAAVLQTPPAPLPDEDRRLRVAPATIPDPASVPATAPAASSAPTAESTPELPSRSPSTTTTGAAAQGRGEATPAGRKRYDRCPKCGTRFDPPKPWNAICPGCGRALFEAARPARTQPSAGQPRQGIPAWLWLLAAMAGFVLLLWLLRK